MSDNDKIGSCMTLTHAMVDCALDEIRIAKRMVPPDDVADIWFGEGSRKVKQVQGLLETALEILEELKGSAYTLEEIASYDRWELADRKLKTE